jgi:hypothetical protein
VRRLLAPALVLTLALPVTARADEIVVLKDPDASVAAETKERQSELGGFAVEHRYDAGVEGFAADLTPEQVRELRSDPEVAAVVPDRRVRIRATTTPPGIRRVTQAAPGLVRREATGAVAVVDSGVDLTHPDLNVTLGKNCIENESGTDLNGHGTHVAGTIAAENDGTGVVGVAPGTEIYSVKVLDSEGSGFTSDILCGLDWLIENAQSHGIEVVNFSLGGPGTDSTCGTNLDPEHEMLCDLVDLGVTPVVAAGNEGADFADVDSNAEYDCPGAAPSCPDAPASFPEVLTVSAITDTDGSPGGDGPTLTDGCAVTSETDPDLVNNDDTPVWFSNYATTDEDAAHLVAAPGMCILSTVNGGGYELMSGTSMAAPHVAGLVALCHGEAGTPGPCANLAPAQVIEHMRDSAEAGAFTLGSARYGPLALLTQSALPVEALSEPIPQPQPQPQPDPQPPAQQEPAPAPPQPPPAPLPGPPATFAPPVVSPAKPKLSFTIARISRLRSKGLRVRISCDGACSGLVRVRVSRATMKKLKLKSPTLATARVRRAGTVTLRLTRAAKRALAKQRSLSATVVADVRSGGRTVRVTKRLRSKR